MNNTEYHQVEDKTYAEYCDYLQNKYGVGLSDYMTKSYNKNQKVSRTKEGLFVHHKMEDRTIMLSDPDVAKNYPFEWQQKENIVYCDYLEHLLLHILICQYPSPEKEDHAAVGIGGAVNFLILELNDIYSSWRPKATWKQSCIDKVINDKNVYLLLIERLVANVKQIFSEEIYGSYNERYGTWSNKNNYSLYREFDEILAKYGYQNQHSDDVTTPTYTELIKNYRRLQKLVSHGRTKICSKYADYIKIMTPKDISQTWIYCNFWKYFETITLINKDGTDKLSFIPPALVDSDENILLAPVAEGFIEYLEHKHNVDEPIIKHDINKMYMDYTLEQIAQRKAQGEFYKKKRT